MVGKLCCKNEDCSEAARPINGFDVIEMLLRNLPSGKRLHNYGKSPCYSWENSLFLW